MPSSTAHVMATDEAALARAREKGLAVVLITNAPRPGPDVVEQFKSLGVPANAWDAVVTSGDVTRDLIDLTLDVACNLVCQILPVTRLRSRQMRHADKGEDEDCVSLDAH